ncbi:hypothetical protein QSJ18_02385 [Gordonia sp. ABSL1-1]|uniref:hypothetical protein n=1 Tax=Gordonia sp. ABSL1-1 TaxID=3053923 RepID=UPI00257430A5|nr:hypothetical protein [Gordonia sp. ABSL1-1]MDL9935584.1 hypothetical protein [Gordonia sp. ABSL1-1]
MNPLRPKKWALAAIVAAAALTATACGSDGDNADAAAGSADKDSCTTAAGVIVGSTLTKLNPVDGKYVVIPTDDAGMVASITDVNLKSQTQQLVDLRAKFNAAVESGDTVAATEARKQIKAPASAIVNACDAAVPDQVAPLKSYLPLLDNPPTNQVVGAETTAPPKTTVSADAATYTVGGTTLKVGESAVVAASSLSAGSGVAPVKITVTSVEPAGAGDINEFSAETHAQVKGMFYVKYTVERLDTPDGGADGISAFRFDGITASGDELNRLMPIGDFDQCDDSSISSGTGCSILATDKAGATPAKVVLTVDSTIADKFPTAYRESAEITWAK